VKIDKEEAIKLWQDGLLDTEIAKHFNCSKEAVGIWRRKNDLPSNKGIFDWGDHKTIAEGAISLKLIDKIKSAKTKKELDKLNVEIILNHEDFIQNQKAYVKRLEEFTEQFKEEEDAWKSKASISLI